MQLIKKHRKEIHLTTDIRRELVKMAADQDTTLKPLIERNLEAMAQAGKDYRALWNECEALRIKLDKISH